MKEGVLKGARDLLEYSKKMANQDPFPSIITETNRLQKEFFDQEEEDNSFNLMNEVSEFKKSAFDAKKTKGGRMY